MSLADCPLSGANAATYTSALTLSLLPASVMTDPAHEWPTSTTGPVCRSIARVVAETSSPRDVSEFCTDVTCRPFASSRGMTLFQLDPSAKAQCPSTMFLPAQQGSEASCAAPTGA